MISLNIVAGIVAAVGACAVLMALAPNFSADLALAVVALLA
jgi:hypothetical protein